MRRAKNCGRVKFVCPPEIQRAILVRAAYDDMTQQDVINAALRGYLAQEITEVEGRLAAKVLLTGGSDANRDRG